MTTTSGISYGTLSTSGSAPRLTGTSSEIDTEALTTALVSAKRLPAVRLETRIATNEAKTAAYGELKTKLAALKDAVAGLRNPPGTLGASQNLFETKEVYYSADTTTAPSSLLSVSAGNKVEPGKFDLVVEQLATARKLSGDSASSSTTALASVLNGGAAFSGGFTIGLQGGGPPATISVDGTMTLEDVKAAINARSGQAGVTASIVKVADADYRLVVSAKETGTEVVMAAAGGDDVLALTGLSADQGATVKNSLAVPQLAKLRLDGVEITRTQNQISDAIDGVTLNLFKADPATTVSVEVERSLGGVKSQLQTLADAYNAFRDVVSRNSVISDNGEVSGDAVLFGDSLLRGLAQNISSMITSPVTGSDGVQHALASIGLKLDGSNRLSVDEATLDKALTENIDAVRDTLEFRFTSSSPQLAVFKRGNELADSAFTLQITDADNDGVPESASADGVAFDVVGNRLVGRDGTDYAGLELLWVGQGSTSIDVTATQGAADKLYNLLDDTLDDVDGSLTKSVDTLEQRNTDYRKEISQIDERVERFRQQLVDKFSAMETALSLAKSMLAQVRAQMQTSGS